MQYLFYNIIRNVTARKPLSLRDYNYCMKKIAFHIFKNIRPANTVTAFLLVLLLITGLTGGSGCANIIPPGGGPKDTLPPVLVSATPKDSLLQFNAKKIVLTFNEYVQLENNMNDNLIVSPFPESVPTVESKLRTVTILLRDSLKPNTTYSINFGKGIKDVNEGNVAKNFTYIFSTGNKLDAGKITGKVLLADNGKTDSTLLVVLHSNLEDSSIKKNNPVYFTRLDGKGNFVFRNLAPATYNVFVLPNEYSKKYDDSTKMFAFVDSAITVTSDSNAAKNVTLYAYRQYQPVDKKRGSGTPNKKKPAKDKEIPKLKIVAGTDGGHDLLSPFGLSLSRKIANFDSTKITLTDTTFKPLKGYSFSEDTTATNFAISYPWKENSFYKLIIQEDAFKDSDGVTIGKNDTLSFKTKREGEYGSIRLHFNNLDLSRNPVILLVQQDRITNSIVLTGKEWFQQLFTPGEYEIHLLYDRNKNGKWDTGDYSKKLQPEIVDIIPRKLTIKANTDTQVDINL